MTKGSTEAEKDRWYWMNAMQQGRGIGRPFPPPVTPDPPTRQIRRADERYQAKRAASEAKREKLRNRKRGIA